MDNRKRLLMAAIEVRGGSPVGSDELIRLALDALLDGVDTPALRQLAGLTRAEEPEARDLFEVVIDELDLAPTLPEHPDDARWVLVRWWCELIADERIEPAAGARRLWMIRHELRDPRPLAPLMAVLAQLDDLFWKPGALPEAGRREIVAAAGELIARNSTVIPSGELGAGP
ncbi:hypothetical protein [Actinophytocola sp. NPDC049390]|uniref:hypothetical protein n=1 Tax=Actinophytocola sp. NPDC049390 TaxID=3363894 RepID=UPI0037874261